MAEPERKDLAGSAVLGGFPMSRFYILLTFFLENEENSCYDYI